MTVYLLLIRYAGESHSNAEGVFSTAVRALEAGEQIAELTNDERCEWTEHKLGPDRNSFWTMRKGGTDFAVFEMVVKG